jgi:2-iminobutanoate/2-iminopropanoate deaminase
MRAHCVLPLVGVAIAATFAFSRFASRKRRCGSLRRVVAAAGAPCAIGPYSQAIQWGDTLYCSGCIGINPESGNLSSDTIEGQTRQALQNLLAIIKAGGSSTSQVLKTAVLLRDMNDYAKVNAIYAEFFPESPPARVCYAVAGLPKNALVEIEAVAAISQECNGPH